MMLSTQSTTCFKGGVFGRCEWPISILKIKKKGTTAFGWLRLAIVVVEEDELRADHSTRIGRMTTCVILSTSMHLGQDLQRAHSIRALQLVAESAQSTNSIAEHDWTSRSFLYTLQRRILK